MGRPIPTKVLAILLGFSWILIGCLARPAITASIGRRYIHAPPRVTERSNPSIESSGVFMDSAVLTDTAGQAALSTNRTGVATTMPISMKLAIAFGVVGIVAIIVIIILMIFVFQQRTMLDDANDMNRLNNRGPKLQQLPPLRIYMRKSVHLVESTEDDIPNQFDGGGPSVSQLLPNRSTWKHKRVPVPHISLIPSRRPSFMSIGRPHSSPTSKSYVVPSMATSADSSTN